MRGWCVWRWRRLPCRSRRQTFQPRQEARSAAPPAAGTSAQAAATLTGPMGGALEGLVRQHLQPVAATLAAVPVPMAAAHAAPTLHPVAAVVLAGVCSSAPA
jgi:hypothetical protein